MEIVRLTKNDYDEALQLLNTVFSENTVPIDFEKALPKMCRRDDKHMGCHLAVRCDGALKAIVGVYPIPVKMAGTDIMFSTVGNVATLKSDAGSGYMTALLDESMRELKRIGADASRLSGKRSRYNRYGFEICGISYDFTLSRGDVLNFTDSKKRIEFKKVSGNDAGKLEFCMQLHENQVFYAKRETAAVFYDVARMAKCAVFRI